MGVRFSPPLPLRFSRTNVFVNMRLGRKVSSFYLGGFYMNKKEKQKFDVLAVTCDRTFVVSPDKTEAFLNVKQNPEIRRQQEEMVKRLNINNLVEEGPVLKKTRKPNR